MLEIPSIWVAAIVYASEIAILSIGFTLTYLTAKIPNFAHGTYAGIGIYVSFTFARLLKLSPYVGFPIAFLFGGVISVIIYILVIGTLTKLGGGAIVLTISTLAIQIFLTALLNIYAFWILDTYKMYSVSIMLRTDDVTLFGYAGIFPIALAICILTVIVLHFLLTKTNTGIAMRSTAEDPELASVLGININRVQIFSWFMTGGLACLAGAMIPMWFLSSPSTGAEIITSIMAGSLLGGLDNVYGAIIGGFGVGLSEILVTTALQQVTGITAIGEYRPLVPMIILVVVLLVEPRGLHGVYDRIKLRSMIKRKE